MRKIVKAIISFFKWIFGIKPVTPPEIVPEITTGTTTENMEEKCPKYKIWSTKKMNMDGTITAKFYVRENNKIKEF
jgi:hypothetical protein